MIDKPGRVIPVFLAPPKAGGADNFVGRPPATPVKLAVGDTENYDSNTYGALLDTGADYTSVDSTVAEQLGAPLKGEAIAHGFATSNQRVKLTELSVFFPTINLRFFFPEVAVVKYRASGQTFDMALGRDFLSHCRMLVDGPNSQYRLEWIG